MPPAFQPYRPRYQSDANTEAESEIAAAVESAFGFQLERLSDWAYRLDFCASRGWKTPILGFVEIKDRPGCPLLKYSGVPVAWHKVTWARFLIEGTDCFAWIVIRCPGGEIIKADLTRPQSSIVLGGRRDRGTIGDIEPMATFPWTQWTYLDGRPVVEPTLRAAE